MKKGKVVFLLSNELSFDQRMQKIGNTLFQNGYQIEILFARKNSALSGVEFEFSSSALPMFFKNGIGFYLELNHRLFWRSLFKNIDIISCVDVDTLIAGTLLKWVKGKKLVIDCHEWYEESPEIINRKWVYKIWKYVAKTLVPKTSVRYTVNDSIRKKMERAYGVPFESILNLPRLDHDSQPSQKREKKTILYQGVLNQGRGLEELIEAMVDLEDFECLLIGGGDLESELMDKVNSLGVSDRVKFTGKILPSELSQITPKAWLGYNLLTGTSQNYYYSLANKFFDYLHAGVPSLNMAYPEYEKYVNEYQVGVCLESCTPQAIVEIILKLKDTKSNYNNMVDNCLVYREQFRWQNQEEALVAIYDKVS